MNPVVAIAGASLMLSGLLALAVAIGVELGRRQARATPRISRREVRRATRRWRRTYLDPAHTGRPVVLLHPNCRCAIPPADQQRPPVSAPGMSKRGDRRGVPG